MWNNLKALETPNLSLWSKLQIFNLTLLVQRSEYHPSLLHVHGTGFHLVHKKNVFFGGISTMVHLSRKLAEKWSSNFQFSALALFCANLFNQVFLLDLFKYSLFCIFLEALCEVDKTIVSETQKFNQRTLSPWHVWVRWDKETCFVFSASLFGFFSWIFCYFSFISL